MFTTKDFKQIDKEYFGVITKTGYHIILKSKNSGHTWDIYCQESGRGRSLVISHKHNDFEPFHVQRKYHPKSVEEAQQMIMKHDKWHLKGLELAKHKREEFEEESNS